MVDAALRLLVWDRAQGRCEFCGLHQDHVPFVAFHVEHILAKVHGGNDDEGNLALACDRCNYHKGTHLAGIDPLTGNIVPLFHPRRQIWQEHFEMGIAIKGKSDTGRATVAVLRMNAPRRVLLRTHLISNGELD